MNSTKDSFKYPSYDSFRNFLPIRDASRSFSTFFFQGNLHGLFQKVFHKFLPKLLQDQEFTTISLDSLSWIRLDFFLGFLKKIFQRLLKIKVFRIFFKKKSEIHLETFSRDCFTNCSRCSFWNIFRHFFDIHPEVARNPGKTQRFCLGTPLQISSQFSSGIPTGFFFQKFIQRFFEKHFEDSLNVSFIDVYRTSSRNNFINSTRDSSWNFSKNVA